MLRAMKFEFFAFWIPLLLIAGIGLLTQGKLKDGPLFDLCCFLVVWAGIGVFATVIRNRAYKIDRRYRKNPRW